MKVIFDCDNTLGVPGSDINDGLALLYLMGQRGIELSGITSSYGNGNIDTVYRNTVNMLKEVGWIGIPVLRGCANRYDLQSEAVDYLVDMVNSYPGECSILATGALTNLYGAYVKDHDFFGKIARLVLMGGVTQPLIINGKIFDEWNFSADPSATLWVLREGKKLTIINHNMGLGFLVNSNQFINRLSSSRKPIGTYILDRCLSWLEYNKLSNKADGFYIWDLLAAVYLVNPHFFKDVDQCVSLNHKKLSKGLLDRAEENEECCQVNMPIISELDELIENIYESWYGLEYNFKRQLRGG